ncbi:MAG: hypothetical protein V3T86_06450 [Planctomycetota bacterium]
MSTKAIRRLFKKYERWFLIGLIVFLLAIFTVVEPLTDFLQGVGQTDPRSEIAGSFYVLPGETRSVTFAEYQDALRTVAITRNLLSRGAERDDPPPSAVWSFLIRQAAADREGIHVSDSDLVSELRGIMPPNLDLKDPIYEQFIRQRTGVGLAQFEEAFRLFLRGQRVRALYQASYLVAPAESRSKALDDYLDAATDSVRASWAALDSERFLEEAATELKADQDPDKALKKFFETSPRVKRERVRFRHLRRYSFELLYVMHKRYRSSEDAAKNDQKRIEALFQKAFPGVDTAVFEPIKEKVTIYFKLYRDRLLEEFGKTLEDMDAAIAAKNEKSEGGDGEPREKKPGDEDEKPGDDDGEKKDDADEEDDPALRRARIAMAREILKPQATAEVWLRNMMRHLRDRAARDESKSLREIFTQLKKHDDPENPICSEEPGKGLLVFKEFDQISGDDLSEISDGGQSFTVNFRHRVTSTAATMKDGRPRVSGKADILGDGGHGRQIHRLVLVNPEAAKSFAEISDEEKDALRDEFYLPANALKRAKERLQTLRKRLVDGEVKAEDFEAEAKKLGCRIRKDEWVEPDASWMPAPRAERLWPTELKHMQDRVFLRRQLAIALPGAADDELQAGGYLEVKTDSRFGDSEPGTAYLLRIEERRKATVDSVSDEALDQKMEKFSLEEHTREARWWRNFEALKMRFGLDPHPDMQERIDEEQRKLNQNQPRG